MSPSDFSESGLEKLICDSLVSESGYIAGSSKEYDREHAVDAVKLFEFLSATQPDIVTALGIGTEGQNRKNFLHQLQGEIGRRGVIDVLRNGFGHRSCEQIELYYSIPTPGNSTATKLHSQNVFSVTRQLRYSRDETKLSLDFAVFVNGLPIATFELKNRITKQTVDDAINQYKQDRDPRELLFQFGRCIVHFAVDDQQVSMCTALKGTSSWFLPFNKGHDQGAGNPPNPIGLKTDYLWKEILSKPTLCRILENYAQIVEEKDTEGKKKRKQIFPRYHQLDCVRKLLDHAAKKGTGQRYLVQHSAGSGKSNSITWLAHQLIDLKKDNDPVFDSILVVTDRVNLDKQIRDNIRQFAQESAVVGAANRSYDLRTFIEQGKKIIITTVQKFPYILDEIGDGHRDRTFALIIDEAHSSQGGKAAGAANQALSVKEKRPEGYGSATEEEELTAEDEIIRIIESRKMLANASYFAFTATPKPKTIELFGSPVSLEGKEKFQPFHSYTMKQAIQEGFIQDVLKNYTTADSYYRIAKTIEEDPKFDANRAKRKLRIFVESHEHAIRKKAEIMVDHFHEQVVAKKKIGGQARAMVVIHGVARAIEYKLAFDTYLKERKSPYKAIIAFSGERLFEGEKATESKMNGFPGVDIPKRFREDPYRFLIVADKYQTGFDEPLLHTMYVDKPLSGIRAVQTLSRLNRAHPQKYDTFVLDFMNDVDTIKESFSTYYRTTVLSEATNPDKLHQMKQALDGHQVYNWHEVQSFVDDYLAGVAREELDPVLDLCAQRYIDDLDEDVQIEFKSTGKAFVRTYSYLSSIIPWVQPNWERLSTFINFLLPKLPAPHEEDLSKGILQTIDMDSYRVEVNAQLKIVLPDADAEVKPPSESGGGGKPPPELDKLSSIIRTFNEHWGNIDWDNKDRVEELIFKEIPDEVAQDPSYVNACQNSDRNTARREHDRAYQKAMTSRLKDQTKLFKYYNDQEGFRNFAHETSFERTYEGHRDRLKPTYELLLSYFEKVTGSAVSSEWNIHAAVFQRQTHNLESLTKWIRSARVLASEEMPLIPSAFGSVDVSQLLRVVDERLHGQRAARYQLEKSLCRGAGIKSLKEIDDSNANRVQDWIVKQIHVAFHEASGSRAQMSLDEWKRSMSANEMRGTMQSRLEEAVGRFQNSHDALVQDESNPDGYFRKSSRTQMAREIGALQQLVDAEIPDSSVIWKLLFQFGESIIKLTSESLVDQNGSAGDSGESSGNSGKESTHAKTPLQDFKNKLGRNAAMTLDHLFRLRCRGDHADDLAKRPEWEQTQHEAAKFLGRDKPKFKKGDSDLLFRPDDLQLTPLEASELKISLLNELADGFEKVASID